MQTVIHFVTEHLDSIFIPLCALCVVRIIMCLLELRRSERLRRNKRIVHARHGQYTEIGIFSGALLGGILALLLGRLWLIGVAVMIALGWIGGHLGRKKGLAVDEQLRQELRRQREEDSPALPLENEEPTERI